MTSASKWQEYLLPLGILAGMLVIFFPLPPMLMDALLSLNICISLMVVLTTIRIKTPLEFSIFPSLLLATTLGRLVLNIATTRLILTNAASHDTAAAGGIIQGFGEFVSGNSIVIGMILFSIILIVQFVVITKGATRISEVAARFTLDGMPGKQMAIDADLNAGLIDQQTAIQRRETIGEEADFFSAMDGASKFVRGDAIAGLVITAINIIGGLAIGMSAGMSLPEAASVFTRLTIGDGLVSQIPAFLIALAAALLVTRSSRPTNLPLQLIQQLFSRPEVVILAGGSICMLSLASMPLIPTLTIGGGCVVCGIMMQQRMDREAAAASQLQQQQEIEALQQPTPVNGQISVDQVLSLNPLEIELGSRLLMLADSNQNGDLLQQINEIRKTIATDLGVVLPQVKIRDNVRLGAQDYRIKVLSNVVANGTLKPRGLIAIDSGNTTGEIDGESAGGDNGHPSGVWITRHQREEAERLGYMVIPPTVVLAHHLRRMAKRFASDLLCRETVTQLVDEVRKTYPALVDELIPEAFSIGQLQAVLKRLLGESVSIRQLGIILETIGDHVRLTSNADELTEIVRARLARTLCERFRDEQGRMPVMKLASEMESRLFGCLRETTQTAKTAASVMELDSIVATLQEQVQRQSPAGSQPVLLVSGSIRRSLKKATANRITNLSVLSYDEIPDDFLTETVATIGHPEPLTVFNPADQKLEDAA